MINIAEKLENAPIGTKLYSVIYGEVTLEEVFLCGSNSSISYSITNIKGEKFSDMVDD